MKLYRHAIRYALLGIISMISMEAFALKPGEYVPGEVIVKFKNESGVVMKANAKGGFATSSQTSLDTRLNNLGIKATEQLMPLTGALPKNKKAPQHRLPNGRVIEKVDLSKLYCLRFDNGSSVEEMVKQLSAMPEVEYAEPNMIVRTCAFETNYSSDPLYSQQWAINAVNLPQLWAMPATDKKRPVIAILDTGVDITHPDLKDNIWTNDLEANGAEFADDDNNGYYDDLHGWDFVKNEAIINSGNDLNGHGTHCAGIAAACGNNGIGVVGANPDALIMPIRVLNARGEGDVATIIRGVDYAASAGADVLSMSYGGYGLPGRAEEEAVQNASFGAICVAAAGNDACSIYDIIPLHGPAISSPAGFECVIGVMSSGLDDSRSDFSNYDPDGPFYSTYSGFYNYDIAAPGEGIVSTFPGGGYKELSGTSMSTPLVAGAISRMLQVGGYDKVKEYGLLGDVAMSRKDGTEVFDASKTLNYDESNREIAIAFSSIEVDDRDLGDGDESFDAGETIDLYPVIRSVWGQVDDDMILSCSFPDNSVKNACTFITNDVEFGYHLNSRGSSKSKSPIRIQVNDSVYDGYNLRLIITAKTKDRELYSQEVSFPVRNKVEIGGVVEDTLILYPNKSYLLSRSLIVAETGKLIVNPGVTITLDKGSDSEMSIKSLPDKEEKYIYFQGTSENPIHIHSIGPDVSDLIITNASLKYVQFENISVIPSFKTEFEHCWFKNTKFSARRAMYHDIRMVNCNFLNAKLDDLYGLETLKNSNISYSSEAGDGVFFYNGVFFYYANISTSNLISCTARIDEIGIHHDEFPNYWGSAKENIARENIFDIEHPTNPWGTAKLDLSNMLKRPVAAAPGIVWKVCVNERDAQDEYDDVLPLGVGKHKFEVYFNRKMRHDFTPRITMGLQEPYTQTNINEEGSWKTIVVEGDSIDVYTAYLTLTGSDALDGKNRISVEGAKDYDYFEIPTENTRFNVMVQAAGSMSTGFMAETGVGKVKLTWENPEENFNDMLGYNVYRYTMSRDEETGKSVPNDTIKINERLLDAEEYTDYDIVPGTTYYYYYRVMRTNFEENSPSKVVSATPRAAGKGDANASGNTDVADVVTEVNYMVGRDPKPFIFDAADVNSDEEVDILDVVGTVNIIMAPAGAPGTTSVMSVATYTIENGILYVDCPVEIAGVQAELNGTRGVTEISALPALNGMENTADWISDDAYRFIAFSLSGKTLGTGRHALLSIDDAELSDLILVDAAGNRIMAIDGSVSGIGTVVLSQMKNPTPNPFTDVINVPVVIGAEGQHDVELSMHSLSGAKMLSSHATLGYGQHNITLDGGKLPQGFYMLTLTVDGMAVQTHKVIKK